MTELQEGIKAGVLQGHQVNSDPKEGIKMLINQMGGFDRHPDKDNDNKCEKTSHPSPTSKGAAAVPQQNADRKDLREETQKMRESMELVTAKLQYEMECRRNQMYELDSLTLQLRKTHSDLQSVTLQRNSLQANLKTMRRQKCYMVGLFEDLKHRHGELKQDFDFISVQHNRTRAMLKGALQEREYWEARYKSTNHVVSDSSPIGVGNCPGSAREEPLSMHHARLNRVVMDAINAKKRNRREFEVGHGPEDKSMAVVSKKQYQCARQTLDARGAPEGSDYAVHKRRELFANVSNCTRE